MVNTLLLTEARSRGHAIYRNVLRRVGYGLQGGRVLTKARLKEILQDENQARVLVNQIMNVGRDVVSTPMQWSFEGKKLDATVKHLSFRPPWVEPGDDDSDNEEGRRYLGTDTLQNVEGRVGLGRFPGIWWTANCKYNSAYDIQRFNSGKEALAAVDETLDGMHQVRFHFVKDNPDIVTYLLALRTGLLMHVVMPSVVPHSLRAPYMSMARFETGPTGNPHYHGFCVGLSGPRMNIVRADVEGVGDEPPDFDSEISVTFAQVFGANDTCEQELREDLVLERLQGDPPAMSLLLQRLDLEHDAIEEAIASDASHSVVEEGVRLTVREALRSNKRKGCCWGSSPAVTWKRFQWLRPKRVLL